MESIQPVSTQGDSVQRARSSNTISDYADSELDFSESLLAGDDEGLVDNPLLRLNFDEVERLVRRFVKEHGFVDQQDVFIKVSLIRT